MLRGLPAHFLLVDPARVGSRRFLLLDPARVGPRRFRLVSHHGHSMTLSSAKHRDVRIILDTGSQRSYVTGGLCEQLKLRPVGTEYLAINTFGKANAQPQKCELVQIEIKGHQNKKSVFITACVVPMICPPPGSLAYEIRKGTVPLLAVT